MVHLRSIFLCICFSTFVVQAQQKGRFNPLYLKAAVESKAFKKCFLICNDTLSPLVIVDTMGAYSKDYTTTICGRQLTVSQTWTDSMSRKYANIRVKSLKDKYILYDVHLEMMGAHIMRFYNKYLNKELSLEVRVRMGGKVKVKVYSELDL